MAPTIFIDYKQEERKEKKIKNVNKPLISTLIFFAFSQSTKKKRFSNVLCLFYHSARSINLEAISHRKIARNKFP